MSQNGTPLDKLSVREIKESREYITKFFSGRTYWRGGEIPRRLLEADFAVYLVAKAGCNLGPQLFHEMLDAHAAAGRPLEGLGDNDTLKRGRLYIQLADECRQMNIPQEYSGGLVVLWLWLCRGVRLAGAAVDRRTDAAA